VLCGAILLKIYISTAVACDYNASQLMASRYTYTLAQRKITPYHTLPSEPKLLETTRLAFAMAAHLEPEILLVDVVLVVEDAAC
jgi:hypothetical protein